MAIAQVQAPAGAVGSDVETIELAWTAPTAAGNLLLAVLQTRDNAHDIVPPANWTLLHFQTTGTTERQWIYYEENCGVRSGTQTFAFSQAGGTDCTLHLVEYSGLIISSVLDQTATNTGSSTTPDSGTTASTVQDDELWFAAICNRNIQTQSNPTNSFTLIDAAHTTNANASSQLEGAIYEAIVAAAGAANTSVTIGSARNWGGLIVTLKGDVGNGEPTPTTVAGTASMATPTVGVTGDIDVTPTTVAAAAAVPDPTEAANATLTTTTVAQAVSIASPTAYPPTTDELIVDHSSPAGYVIDARQRRFKYHRPPFVLPSRDP